MFQDQYKADNEKIKPDEATLKHLAYKMEQESGVAPPRKRRFIPAVAAITAACMLLVFTVSHFFGESIRQEQQQILANTEKAQTNVSYEDLYSLIRAMQKEQQRDSGLAGGAMQGEAESSVTDSAESGSNEEELYDYSGTNVQVEGIDEADIIKTDGKYIYALTDSALVIVEVSGAQMEVKSTISRTAINGEENELNITELYLRGDRLVLIAQVDPYFCYGWGEYGAVNMANKISTQAIIYDVSDRSAPKQVGAVGQSGYTVSTRMVGDVLYLVTNYMLYEDGIDRNIPETYVPTVSCGEESVVVEASDICISVSPESVQYIVVSSFDVNDPEKQITTKSVFGCGNTLYLNAENLLVASGTVNETKVSEQETKCSFDTSLIRFALDEGQIGEPVFGDVPGTLLNQFSMDEHNGYFRLVTTKYIYTETQAGDVWSSTLDQESSNALYTLDRELKVVGQIEDLAPGETVYSVRFSGDIGYFVTFRQVDPLFTVDLSNPASPQVLSALKIPGFSEYLHPYGDGLLFGFGKEAEEETGEVSGLKLSMFDTSDPANVTEKDKLLLTQSWSDASYNHKAILVSPQRGLIAFPADNSYLIFSYSAEEGFVPMSDLRVSDDTNWGSARGLYINDYFYIFSASGNLNVFSISTFEHLSGIQF